MFSMASAAVTLHFPFMILVSQEGKSRAPEAQLLGLAKDENLNLLSLSFLFCKIGTHPIVMRIK